MLRKRCGTTSGALSLRKNGPIAAGQMGRAPSAPRSVAPPAAWARFGWSDTTSRRARPPLGTSPAHARSPRFWPRAHPAMVAQFFRVGARTLAIDRQDRSARKVPGANVPSLTQGNLGHAGACKTKRLEVQPGLPRGPEEGAEDGEEDDDEDDKMERSCGKHPQAANDTACRPKRAIARTGTGIRTTWGRRTGAGTARAIR